MHEGSMAKVTWFGAPRLHGYGTRRFDGSGAPRLYIVRAHEG